MEYNKDLTTTVITIEGDLLASDVIANAMDLQATRLEEDKSK